MNNHFHYHSLRASEARLGKAFESKAMHFLLGLIAVILFGLTAFVVIYKHNSSGWFFFSIATIIIMFLVWLKRELLRPAPGNDNNITNIL